LTERFKSYECSGENCDFVVWKTVAGRLLSREEVQTLIRDRQIGPLTGFRSKAKRGFDAVLKLTEEFKVEFDFAATTEAAKTDILCDKCGRAMIIRTGWRGEFLACSGYPECQNAKSFQRDAAGKIIPVERPPEVKTDEKCEKCGSPMVIKNSRRGPFLACSGYPKCKNAKPVPEELKAKLPKAAPQQPPELTNEKCEKCGAPLLKRQGRYGPFLGCSAYPKCKNIKKLESAAG
jgi:DNA topoisomerase-1